MTFWAVMFNISMLAMLGAMLAMFGAMLAMFAAMMAMFGYHGKLGGMKPGNVVNVVDMKFDVGEKLEVVGG